MALHKKPTHRRQGQGGLQRKPHFKVKPKRKRVTSIWTEMILQYVSCISQSMELINDTLIKLFSGKPLEYQILQVINKESRDCILMINHHNM